MPELPEVETVRRGIAPLVTNAEISAVICRVPKLRWPLTPQLPEQLVDQRIESVERRAKYLLFKVQRGTLIVHLGMSGVLRVVNVDTPLQKHDHVDIILKDGKCLRLNDSRRFGAVLFTETPIDDHPLFSSLGPEPLSDDFTGEVLYRRSRRSSGAIKNFIMNQKVVVGVGNIYACEALFHSGIRPTKSAATVSKKRYWKLVDAIKLILAAAIDQGGTTIRDFAGAEGKPGYFKQSLKVYGRAGLPCTVCGQDIKNIKLAGRSTFYCPTCQNS
ncbi:MAG: DNA-formamidopyrimidine glycosylase [Desulfuromonas sp.]|nr:MAG: DNA-formamidopyrimidine glycosylase [Desulfuromonas sp.]